MVWMITLKLWSSSCRSLKITTLFKPPEISADFQKIVKWRTCRVENLCETHTKWKMDARGLKRVSLCLGIYRCHFAILSSTSSFMVIQVIFVITRFKIYNRDLITVNLFFHQNIVGSQTFYAYSFFENHGSKMCASPSPDSALIMQYLRPVRPTMCQWQLRQR